MASPSSLRLSSPSGRWNMFACRTDTGDNLVLSQVQGLAAYPVDWEIVVLKFFIN